MNRDITAAKTFTNDFDHIAIGDTLDEITIQLGSCSAECVLARTAMQRIGTSAARQEVISDLATQNVVTGTTYQPVIAHAAENRVITGTTVNDIRAVTSGDQIVSGVTAESEPDIPGVYRVVASCRDIGQVGGVDYLLIGKDRVVARGRRISAELELLDPVEPQQPVIQQDHVAEVVEITLAGLPKAHVQIDSHERESRVGEREIEHLKAVELTSVDRDGREDMAKRTLRDQKVIVVNVILTVTRRIDIDVISAAAIQRVGSGSALQRVETRVLVQYACHSRGTLEKIVSGATVQVVVVLAAIDGVVAIAAKDGVISERAVHLIRAGVPVYGVLPPTGLNCILAASAIYDVVALARNDGIIPRRAIGDQVHLVGIGDRVIAKRAGDVRHDIDDIQHRAVVEMNFLNAVQLVLPILDGDGIGKVKQVGGAVANADEQLVIDEGHP